MSQTDQAPAYAYTRSPDQDADAPVRHPVIIVGAGPVGLCAAIDLALHDVPCVVLDDNDRISIGSRAICFAKRTLEILDRLGCGEELTARGVTWNTGKVFFGERQVYGFNLLAEEGHQRPAFINLQQYHLENALLARLRVLQAKGKPVELRGRNRVVAVEPLTDGVYLRIETPEGPYKLISDWLIAADGANSEIRRQLGLDFVGRVFEDNFLIADVKMRSDLPTERRFWFDPPFNPGQSALLHKQPDDIWRIDLQIGWDIDREKEKRPENVLPRIHAFLGDDAEFELEWISIYTFQCRRMERFVHGRVVFAGDAAHQVSPFGARGANSGIQDVDNLCWKLKTVITGAADERLIASYDAERVQAADENITASTRSTDFITPKTAMSRVFRDAVLDLAGRYSFARPLVNSGRLSVPAVHMASPLNGPDDEGLPAGTRPGAPAPDAPLGDGWLLSRLGGRFVLLAIDTEPPRIGAAGHGIECVAIRSRDDPTGALRKRYLGGNSGALYLIRPDQHVAARWVPAAGSSVDGRQIRDALGRALARETA